ncbi:carbohydrate ABC transporter permease [Paenibacillus durus]|uniref:ABC transporter permease n=1 Tax=Paenibacillus durus TaxID=44251 RepID=A0A089HKL5_PAEDU|nr:sugar ABC transporter permease [Paenibacillus durus]AIQ12491.1 ABC transporter permease [Paenibacillus durus]
MNGGLRVPRRIYAVFVLPSLLVYLLLVFFPILTSVYFSMLNWSGIGKSKFIGLQNFVNLFTKDPVFWTSLKNTFLIVGYSLIELPLTFLIAILVNRHVRRSNFLISVYFIPIIMSSVVVGQLWKAIYNPVSQGGMLNKILISTGLESWTKAWIADPSTAIYALIIVGMWQVFGYYVLLYFTAIRGIPDELFEAARIDGAEGLKADLHITLPLVGYVIKISTILMVVGALKAFDIVLVMTGGGPAHKTEVISSYMYNMSFISLKYGYGSALSTVLVLLCLIATVIMNKAFKRFD